jgi:DNA-binding PadR family transcriptional regulator
MARQTEDQALGHLGRYAGPATLILSSLADGPKHGYLLMKDIEGFAAVRVGPGTLYGALSRLEEGGLVESLSADERRHPYRITEQGRKALRAQLLSQRTVADVGLARLSGPVAT